ncbi:MAG: metallophosphoesterase, partial [bacterium]
MILIPWEATWRYRDNGSNQGTAWRETTFDDSSWTTGPAELGYGDGDEATLVSFGGNPNNKYTTTYFRRVFQVQDPAQYAGLRFQIIRDDGAVVYLNGTEVFRSNMP